MSVTFSVCHETEQYLWQGADLRAFYYLVEMCDDFDDYYPVYAAFEDDDKDADSANEGQT